MAQAQIIREDFVNDAGAQQVLRRALGEKGLRVYRIGKEKLPDENQRGRWYARMIRGLSGQSQELEDLVAFAQQPVDIETFLRDPFFMGKGNDVYPEVLKELREINSGSYIEAILTGGIGSGKTTVAHYTLAYQIYVLSCMRDPHAYFRLDKSSEILFVLQSLTATHAKTLEYNRFRTMIEHTHYFTQVFPFDKGIESRLIFPRRIEVTPVSGQETAIIGQNVIGGLLDEVNYMAVVEESKSSVDGGTYDQAWALYNSIARRRKSRFLKNGRAYGMLCLVSSKRYPGQFTDIKEQEARTQRQQYGASEIYVYDKRAWEVVPSDRYSGDTFRVFVGDQFRKPRVLAEGEQVAEEDEELVMAIPVEYRSDFDQDIINALREIAGVSTLAAHPYILDTEAVTEAMKKGRKSLFDGERTDFEAYPVRVFPKRIKNPEAPRAAHLDLSVTSDSTGLTIGHVERFVRVDRGDAVEYWPRIVIDAQLEIVPPKGSEIKFYKVRELLYKLREAGLPIQWVTFDSYQSVDSMQILRQKGFVTGLTSMDTSIRPYAFAKGALYDRRIEMPEHAKCRTELLSIELDPKKEKIDHPASGSKDVADSFAGVVYRLTTAREIWMRHDISPDYVPDFVKDVAKKEAA